MATSLIVPIAYITVLVTGLAIFSRVYRRRKAAEKTTWEAWFPTHPSRDIYISLLSSPSSNPVPDSLLKSALLVRATADVKRIWRLRDDKQALTNLHNRGLVGDDTMARFAAAEKELEAEIVDVVGEANTFRQGWGGMIFQTATEMAHAEKTRETVLNIPKIKEREDTYEVEKKMLLRRKLMGEPLPRKIQIKGGSGSSDATEVVVEDVTPKPAPASTSTSNSIEGSPAPSTSAEFASQQTKSQPGSGANTPSKNTPNKKKKGKK